MTLDIDDTVDVAHGRQRLSFFNAYYDEYCFLPIHVYDTERSRPVAVLLRPGRTPKGTEVRRHLRRLVRRIRRRWPATRITFRGDSPYACPEAMAFCEQNGIDYIFALAGTKPLARKVEAGFPMPFEPSVRSRTRPWCAATPRPATRQVPGIASAASSPVSRRPSKGSISATSSPACASAPPNGSTTASIAHAAGPT